MLAFLPRLKRNTKKNGYWPRLNTHTAGNSLIGRVLSAFLTELGLCPSLKYTPLRSWYFSRVPNTELLEGWTFIQVKSTPRTVSSSDASPLFHYLYFLKQDKNNNTKFLTSFCHLGSFYKDSITEFWPRALNTDEGLGTVWEQCKEKEMSSNKGKQHQMPVTEVPVLLDSFIPDMIFLISDKGWIGFIFYLTSCCVIT